MTIWLWHIITKDGVGQIHFGYETVSVDITAETLFMDSEFRQGRAPILVRDFPSFSGLRDKKETIDRPDSAIRIVCPLDEKEQHRRVLSREFRWHARYLRRV